MFPCPGVRPGHGVDLIYSVGPTLLALGPRCGRPGCDVVFPHPRVIWRFEWLYLVVGTFCHWTAFGGSGVMACVPSFVVATCCVDWRCCWPLFYCCTSFIHYRWCCLSRSCLAVACMIRPCVYLACLTHRFWLIYLSCFSVAYSVGLSMPGGFCWPCCIRHYVMPESSDAAGPRYANVFADGEHLHDLGLA